MSSEFRREHRYTVLKQTDIQAAVDSGGVTEKQVEEFNWFCRMVHIARFHVRGKEDPLECVVVEHDWRIYESVWSLVEMEHEFNEAWTPPTQEEIDKFDPEIGPLYHPTGMVPNEKPTS